MIRHLFHTIIKLMEAILNDYTKLNEAIATLSAKVDAMNAKPPVSDQPAIDAITEQVVAITAKIPE